MSVHARIRDYLPALTGLVLPLFALNPLQNIPFRDDWTYAWSVENFLNNHTLRILDWSTHINVAQILWGALFCWPLGFSFTALRLSTWVLSVFGLIGLYFLLREVEAPFKLAVPRVLHLYPVTRRFLCHFVR